MAIGVVAAAAIVLIEPLLRDSPDLSKDALGGSAWTAGIVSVLVVCVLGRTAGAHVHTYPPVWLGAWSGYCALAALAVVGYSPMSELLEIRGSTAADRIIQACKAVSLMTGVLAVAACSGALFHAFQDKRRQHAARVAKDGVLRQGAEMEDSELWSWLDSDKEIVHPNQDRFGFNRVAQRVAQHLRAAQVGEETEPAVIILGEFGSGKSTIVRLVQHDLCAADGPVPRTVLFGLAEYTNAGSAISGLLDAIIDALKKDVDVTSIRGVPHEYATLVRAGGGLVAAVGEAMGSRSTPHELLDRIEQVLVATEIRLVIAIEDFGRYRGADNESLASFHTLLHLLGRRQGIAVVAAVERLAQTEVHKLARYIELVPSLDPSAILDVVEAVIVWCRNHAKNVIVLPSSEGAQRESLFVIGNTELRNMLFTSMLMAGDVRPALIRLLANPRQLKSAMRYVRACWEPLAGEIDLEHVVVLSAIRVTSTEAFDEVVQWLLAADARASQARVRSMSRSGHGNEDPELSSKAQLKRDVESALERSGVSQHMARDVCLLADELASSRGGIRGGNVGRPQGLQQPYYLRRALSPHRLDEAERDQPVLSALFSARKGNVKDLVTCLLSPGAEKVVHFGGLLDPHTFGRVVRTALARQMRSYVAQDDRADRSCAGLLFRLGREVGDVSSILQPILARWLRYLARRNLALGHELVAMFAHHHDHVPSLLLPARMQELADTFHQSFGRAFVPASVDRLGSAIHSNQWWLCYWISWRLERLRAEALPAIPFAEWPSFASVLLMLAERNPRVGIPQLIPFLVGQGIDGRGQSIRPPWRSKEASVLFADGTRLASVLLSAAEQPEWSADQKLQVEVAKEWAAAHMASQRGLSRP